MQTQKSLSEARPSTAALQHCQLLAENQILEEKVPARTEEHPEEAEDQSQPVEHDGFRAVSEPSIESSTLLFQRQISILARDRP